MSGRRTYVVFDRADAFLAAARRLRDVPSLDAHAPYHLPDLAEAMGLRASRVRPTMLAAGALGAVAMLGLQWWDRALRYPMNSGGRPLDPWPAYGFAVFEIAVLAAAFAGFAALVIGGRLARLNDPFFATARTERASDDRFYLSLPSGRSPDRSALEALPGVVEIFEAPA